MTFLLYSATCFLSFYGKISTSHAWKVLRDRIITHGRSYEWYVYKSLIVRIVHDSAHARVTPWKWFTPLVPLCTIAFIHVLIWLSTEKWSRHPYIFMKSVTTWKDVSCDVHLEFVTLAILVCVLFWTSILHHYILLCMHACKLCALQKTFAVHHQ